VNCRLYVRQVRRIFEIWHSKKEICQ